jgi:hypothetical protein
VILYRCFPWDREAAPQARGGALWFPRRLQGDARHDAPELYGCLYASEEPVSAVVELLARFRGTRLRAGLLSLGGLPAAIAALQLADRAAVVDLDEPRVLTAERLRPSRVVSRDRATTQADARALHARRPGAAAVRWWSTFEPRWPNLTVFDRAAEHLAVRGVRALSLEDDVVVEAARYLGLR